MTTLQFVTAKPVPTADQLAQAERLEQEAKDNRRRSAESFDRCDTDGFLSQWALDIGADLNRRKAELLRDGGFAQFPVLCDAAGNVIATRVYKFPDKYSFSGGYVRRWRLPDELAAKAGRKWIPVRDIGESRIQKQLGLHEEDRWFPAYAKITTGGRNDRGLSGCANAFVGVFKQGEGE